MMIDEWAITFNLFSIAVLGLLTATAFLCVVWLVSSGFIVEMSARVQKMTLGLFLVTPWLASIFCIFIFTPSLIQLNRFEWLESFAHWHHPYVFNLDSWHGFMLVVFVFVIIYVLARRFFITFYHLNSLKILTELFHEKKRGIAIQYDVVVLESNNPSAFTAGLFRPKCYITTGLINQITETELNIIIDHERAHIRNKDTWLKLIFSLFSSLYPRPIARQLEQFFSLSIEQLADSYVSHSYNKFDIAKTLVKAARLQLTCAKSSILPAQAFFVADDVEVRVRELVTPSAKRSFSWFFCSLILTLTLLVSTYGVDGLHHLAESVFSH